MTGSDDAAGVRGAGRLDGLAARLAAAWRAAAAPIAAPGYLLLPGHWSGLPGGCVILNGANEPVSR
jgi:hypothetical protein